MGYKKHYIVVFNNEIEDFEFALSEARELYFSDYLKTAQFEIILSEQEILNQYFLNILEIINDFNNSMIGLDEDDIIYFLKIKRQCYKSLLDYCDSNTCSDKINDLISLNAYPFVSPR